MPPGVTTSIIEPSPLDRSVTTPVHTIQTSSGTRAE
jgi:hypothetical protein